MFDSKGLIHAKRKDLDENKKFFVQKTQDISLEKAFVNADVFLGLSKGGIVQPHMIKSMGKKPNSFCLSKSKS
jgi:malate dehydrogenase (oxaloacetate-decarboxylating)(NADP+)